MTDALHLDLDTRVELAIDEVADFIEDHGQITQPELRTIVVRWSTMPSNQISESPDFAEIYGRIEDALNTANSPAGLLAAILFGHPSARDLGIEDL